MKIYKIILLFIFASIIHISCTRMKESIKIKTGAIAGIAKDLTNLKNEFKSNITILNANYGCLTGVHGDFLLLELPIGIYDIRASSVNYQHSDFLNVRIATDSVTILKFGMTPEALPIIPSPKMWDEPNKEMFNTQEYISEGKLFDLKW